MHVKEINESTTIYVILGIIKGKSKELMTVAQYPTR